jgi:hypothetical protein
MNICPFCERNNHDDAGVCSHCGRGLSRLTGLSTLLIDDKTAMGGLSDRGSDRFAPNMSVLLRFREVRDLVTLPLVRETILGRVSPSSASQQPDIDLSYFKAYECGVSSRHVTLKRADQYLMLTDLGSTNGTYRNGERLLPYQSAIIHSGDEVRLGSLVMTFYFQETIPTH